MIVEEKEEFVKDDTLSKRYSLILHENVGVYCEIGNL